MDSTRGNRFTSGAAARPEAVLAFALLYVVLGLVGRSTTIEGTPFGLVWPAGGVAVLWFLVRGARALSVDTAVLVVASFVVNWVTGASPGISAVLVATNVLQTLLAVTLLRRWCPRLWGCGGDEALDSPRVLARYLAATSLATAAGALLGMTAFAVIEGNLHVMGGVLWFGRNLCSVLTVTTLGLLLGQRFADGRSRRAAADTGGGDRLELLAAVAFTTGMYALAFAFEELPLAFPLLGPAMWFALRFPTVVGAWHSALVGAATVALTLGGVGPFAHVESPELGALLAQFFVMAIVVTTLALSTGRDERDALGFELRRTEAEAVYEASVRDAIIGSMAEGLLVADDAGELLVSNQAARDLLGAPSARGTLAAIPAQRVDGTPLRDAERPLARALRGESVRDLELRTAGDAGHRILAVSAVPLPRDLRRDRARALVLSRDVTSEHAHREELSAFAGVVAHDLRNPLAAIDGWTEMFSDELQAGELDPDLAHEFVSRVRSSSSRMHALIGDLLDHATSDARALDPTRVDVAAMVAEVAAARHAEGAISCGPVPAVVADPVLLRQVVDNLLGNALKYVAPGEEPKIEVTGEAKDGLVVVSVADHGVGLPAGEHERIFDEFHRAHFRDYEGSGLGLSICRRIISRHGGTIVARDNPAGRGTVFEFTLPEHNPVVAGHGG